LTRQKFFSSTFEQKNQARGTVNSLFVKSVVSEMADNFQVFVQQIQNNFWKQLFF
jgi:hypothetical protein